MSLSRAIGIVSPVFLIAAVLVAQNRAVIVDADSDAVMPLPATVVATGIPGAGAIAQVGTFHKGGPFAPGGALEPATHPVLERTRLLVASTSNFGAPLARPTEAPGSILSLNTALGVVNVPPDFANPNLSPPAIGTGQPYAAGGAVILYTAQSPPFLNGKNNPAAVTADRPSVSLPLGISLNNGFGRPWFANAPAGAAGAGTISVVDPSGIGLAGAPDPVAGGVFASYITNRQLNPPDPTEGLTTAAVATALATKSPDLAIPQRAVFFAALADGSIAQVHVQKGVDPLAAAGSFTAIPVITTTAAESNDADSVTRVGMLFNWAPARILYVSDPLANRILALDISDEGTSPQTVFTAANRRYLRSPRFDVPVDIAPAVPEVGARNFASNTTLGAGSDIYVLNRGDNTIVRITQGGDVVAMRRIEVLSNAAVDFRANGIAVSEDARVIWVTATTPNRGGVVLQMSTFGGGAVTTSMLEHAENANANGAVAQGANIFATDLQPEQRLGPLFNARSCDSCHNTAAGADFDGGMGVTPDTFVRRVARIEKSGFDPLAGHGGPIARQHSIAELGFPCGLRTGDPPQANVFSDRSAMTLRGTSRTDNIRIGDIDKLRSRSRRPCKALQRPGGWPHRQVWLEGTKSDARGVHGRSVPRRDRHHQSAGVRRSGEGLRGIRAEARGGRRTSNRAGRVSQHHRSADSHRRVPGVARSGHFFGNRLRDVPHAVASGSWQRLAGVALFGSPAARHGCGPGGSVRAGVRNGK